MLTILKRSSLACIGIALSYSACAVAKSTVERVTDRDYPSIFQAWSGIDDEPNIDRETLVARHDLFFHAAEVFGLKWNNKYRGLADGVEQDSIPGALAYRDTLRRLNPNMVLLAELRYRDAGLDETFLPNNSPDWMYNTNQSDYIYGWKEGNAVRINFRRESYQDRVASRAAALVNSGVVDGVMLDWWTEFETDIPGDFEAAGEPNLLEARLSLLQKIRDAIGPDKLILVNSNEFTVPLSAKNVNGLFMESGAKTSPEHWQRTENTLTWAENNLRYPQINLLETWFTNSRNEQYIMRANTTMSMTLGNGYSLFADPNDLLVNGNSSPDHEHTWYPFWNEDMGKPKRAGVKRADGAWEREYDNGLVVYNPPGNGVVYTNFDNQVRSVANDVITSSHSLNALDGDFYIGATSTVSPAKSSIGNYAPPKSLIQGETYTLNIPYTSDDTNRLIVTLQNADSKNWDTYASGFTDVSAGEGTAEIAVTVAENAPNGTSYHWQVFITPKADPSFANADANRLIGGVSVGASATADSISDYNAPKTLTSGSSYDFNVPVSVSQNRILHITLQDLDKDWITVAATTAEVKPGQDSVNVSVTVNDNVQPGDNFQWQVFLTSPGGSWEQATASRANGPVSVVSNDALAELDVIANGTYRIRDDYQGFYMHAEGNQLNNAVSSFNFVEDWWSQRWIIENQADGTSTIKNLWTGFLLSANPNNTSNALVQVDSNPIVRKARWVIKPAEEGNFFIQNRDTDRYITASDEERKVMRDVARGNGWNSQRFYFERID